MVLFNAYQLFQDGTRDRKKKSPRRNEGIFSIACHYKRVFICVWCCEYTVKCAKI